MSAAVISISRHVDASIREARGKYAAVVVVFSFVGDTQVKQIDGDKSEE